MNCPFCEHGETKVVDSRVAGRGAIRRRRECLICSQRFTTFERVEETPLYVVKRDGLRQPFDRAKLLAGLTRACVKRPVSLEQIEQAAPGAIVDLHDGWPRVTSTERDRTPTAQALAIALPRLAELGYRFVTVSELLAA